MPILEELSAAATFGRGRADPEVDALPLVARIRALAWMPIVGAMFGAGAAYVAWLARDSTAPMVAFWAVLALRIVARSALRVSSALVVGLVQWLAVAMLAPSARSIALVTAPMLARWAVVVQCYGGAPAAGATGLATLAGRARFREFAIASVIALGTMLAALDAVGLAIAVACALVTLGVRTVAYRRRGGIDAAALNATSALVETSALVLFAIVGVWLGRA